MIIRFMKRSNFQMAALCAAFVLSLLGSSGALQAELATSFKQKYEQAEELRLGKAGVADLAAARRLHSELIAEGYARSLVRLADIEEREGNHAAAIEAYEDAIASGSSYAKFRLIQGHVESRFGVFSKPEKGFADLEVLSSQNSSKQAQFLLAKALERGLGTEPDQKRAMELLSKLGKEGHGQSLARLGALAFQNPGNPADYGPAISYYRDAANSGYDYALIGLSRALLADGQSAAALAVSERSVKLDVRTASARLASWHYEEAFGPASDKAFGRRELARLAEAGDVLAARWALISHERRSRRITEMDLPKVLAGLEHAAAKGNRLATVSLARAYRNLSFLIPDARIKHAALVSNYGDQMGVRSEVPERLHALYDRNDHRSSRQKAYEFLKHVEGEGFGHGLLRLRTIERTAYVYVLQKELADLGYFSGRATGLLTNNTISAIFDYCDASGISATCIHGPINYDTSALISKSLAELRGRGS